jgi:hypothetical protein
VADGLSCLQQLKHVRQRHTSLQAEDKCKEGSDSGIGTVQGGEGIGLNMATS